MYSALRADRGISSKSISYGLWFPQTAHVEVIQARGTMFAGMGFSNMRTCLNPQDDQADGEKTAWKSLELLPEEALFLIERGSMYCWRVDSQVIPASGRNKEKVPGDVVLEDVLGVPMSVQQAFAEMISGDTGLSLEKYQVRLSGFPQALAMMGIYSSDFRCTHTSNASVTLSFAHRSPAGLSPILPLRKCYSSTHCSGIAAGDSVFPNG